MELFHNSYHIGFLDMTVECRALNAWKVNRFFGMLRACVMKREGEGGVGTSTG